jgi:hypothetical protein
VTTETGGHHVNAKKKKKKKKKEKEKKKRKSNSAYPECLPGVFGLFPTA